MRALISLLLLVSPASISAQEIRSTISGLVTDPTEAPVPSASVSAKNTATGLTVTVACGDDGTFFLPYLPAGPYEIVAEAPGFRKFVRQGITLAAGERANVNVRLEVGTVTDSVTVTSELSSIETDQSVMGQLVDSRRVADLPLNGRNFLMLLPLSSGTIFTPKVGPGGWTGTRQWESGPGVGQFSMHGSRPGTNAFFVDGAPQGIEGGASYIPQLDAIAEVKVVAPTSDASQGLSGGGVVHVTMKSGTNDFHGLASEFLRNNIFDANATQTNRAAAQDPSLKTQRQQWNNFSGMLSGPVIRNKLFFAGSYDGYRLRVPRPMTITVPTQLQRAGDFSQTFNASGQPVIIYDPLTTRQEGSQFVRDAFPGNRIPANRISPTAQNILKYNPLPNTVTNPVTNFNNYANPANIGKQTYDGFHLKFDYIWNERHRTTASTTANYGNNFITDNAYPFDNPAAAGSHGPSTRDHRGAILDHVWAVSPTTVINGRLAWDRWFESAQQRVNQEFDASQLGFQTLIGATPVNHFPAITFEDYTAMGGSTELFQTYDTYAAVFDISRAAGKHLIKTGVRLGQGRYNYFFGGDIYGRLQFTRGFTQRDPLRADATSGNAIASLLLGYPAAGGADVNARSSYQNYFASLYLQDDFKVSRSLTLYLGLRWDVQTPSTERYNRMIRGFDPTVTYSLGNAQAKGGLIFAGDDNRSTWSTNGRDFQPRFGAAYQMTKRVIARAGYGISYLPINSPTVGGGRIDQTGFSRRTPLTATLGGGVNLFIPGLPGTGTLTNPYPGGILQPFGSALGPKTQLGQAVSFWDPDFVVPRVHQFHIGLQFDLPWRTSIETSYVGSRTRRMPVSQSQSYLSTEERLRAFADPTYPNQTVENPYFGAPELAGTFLAGPMVTVGTLLVPYPQFSSVFKNGIPIGEASFNSLQVRGSKRFSDGITFTGVYTWSKTLEAMSYREPQYTDLYRVLAAFDRTHHFSLSALYELPFGRSKPIGADWHSAVDGILGGWQLNYTTEFMSGTPTPMPDATPVRDPRLPEGPTFDRYFNTCTQLANGNRSGCLSPNEAITWVQLKPFEFRTFSPLFPNLRDPMRPIHNFSLFKTVPIHESWRAEFRWEVFNAFNSPIYNGPNTSVTSPLFGVVLRDQWNNPRSMQFALRIKF